MSDDTSHDDKGSPNGAPPNGTNGVSGSAPLTRSFANDRKRVSTQAQAAQQLDRDELARWILETSDPGMKKFQCQGFVLVNRGGDREPLDHFVIPKSAGHVERQALASRCVERFAAASWEDACGFPFKQSYTVLAQLSDDPHGEPYVTKPFVVTPPPEASQGFAQNAGLSSGGSGLDPNSTIGNLQRLVDRMFTLQTESTQAMMDRFADAEQRARDREERIAVERERLWADRERLLSEQADREAKNYASRIEAHAYGQLVEGGLKYAGVFAEAVMSQKFGSAHEKKLADELEPAPLYYMLSTMNEKLREAFQPFGEKIVKSWPEHKRLEFARIHAEAQTAKLAAATPAVTAASTPPAPSPQTSPPATVSETAAPAPRWADFDEPEETDDATARRQANEDGAWEDAHREVDFAPRELPFAEAAPGEPDRDTVKVIAAPVAPVAPADPSPHKPAAAKKTAASKPRSKRKT